MRYFLTQSQPAFAGQQKSQINEPSVGTGNDVVFVSSNWDAAYSTNRGSTFTFVNPYTQFPSIDGGFCCDQTVIYAPSTKTMIWQLQYSYSAATQKNTYRIAFAPAESVASAGWCYYDWNPQQFGQAAGTEFDYPDVSLSNNFVWFQARIFSQTGFVGTAVWRMPLTAASQCQALTANFYVTPSSIFTVSLAKGATTTMYFFGHNSTSQERLFNWPEGSGTISWNDVNVTTWFDAARSCPGPDALNWCARNNGSTIGRTSWVAGGVIGTMWSSSQGGGRPYPYVRVARFNESTKALINEPDIWNASHAYIYPSVSVNDRGHLGGVVFYGGGTLYPNLLTLIWDDFSSAPAPWELYFAAVGSAGATSWGDYTTTRRHGASGNTWVGTGQFKPSASAVNTYYLWFGRERDQPPTNDYFPNAFAASAGGSAAGSNVNATKQEGEPNHAGAGGRSVWWRLTPGRSGLVTIDTVGSSFDTLLAVYTGGAVTALAQVAANDDCPGSGVRSCVTFAVAAGTTYRIAVDGFGGSAGNIQLNVSAIRMQPHDFSGDIRSDVLWRYGGGDVAMWFMNGASITSGAGLGSVDNSWQIAGTSSLVPGTGDFNGDDNADILWRHSSGDVAMWLMDGSTILSGAALGNVDNSWQITGVGDFSGNGRSDILWRHSGGSVALWFMNGASISSGAGVGSVDVSWQIAGIGDFNGDGKSDLLWRHSGGNVALWIMSGAGISSSTGLGAVDNSWQIAGVADFNGDGKADILWRNSGGDVVMWFMNGASIVSGTNLGVVDTNWRIVSTGDYNKDAKSDILWRHTDGTVAMWLMNGSAITSSVAIGAVDNAWVVVE